MVDKISDLDLNKSYSYADYLTWQFDEYVELIKGKIFQMSPAPRAMHQRVQGKIYNRIYNYLENKKCEVFVSPFDVRIPLKNQKSNDTVFSVVQPDICIVCEESKIDEKGCNGAPDFIAEILSPSTMRKDANEKYSLYEEAGVKEYWLVWPEDKAIQIFDLENGVFVKRGLYEFEGKVFIKSIGEFELDLKDIFAIK